MFSSTRTTRTYQYSSSGGPGGATVTSTTTTDGPDGRRTETTTQGGDSNEDFGLKAGFGRMKMGGSVGDGGRSFITSNRSRPVESGSRFIRGWGSRRERPSGKMELKGKTYSEIKAECQSSGRLFEDPDFPAVDTSIFYSRAPPRPFVWKRPHVSRPLNPLSTENGILP